MVTIFKHHISMWLLVEIVADWALCFLAASVSVLAVLHRAMSSLRVSAADAAVSP